ncbi:peptidyl-prolyl cis-trans isomerase ppiB [Vibrio ishigakensis]|uniref:peptidylprolyl isomerase n=1 Tax=Vibrio ishigakensis TaxID=1481914 RepID=A0A0B8QIN8_9VIBR|nr:peptidyl-prolyl cis-trans isomerase ppiB [Vibrio ishigakensis]
MIIFHTTHGDIEIELNLDKAPVTSKNFKKYCEDGFYEGTIFHRVIKVHDPRWWYERAYG